jgi:conjugal transfer pilus assembly protein TraF
MPLELLSLIDIERYERKSSNNGGLSFNLIAALLMLATLLFVLFSSRLFADQTNVSDRTINNERSPNPSSIRSNPNPNPNLNSTRSNPQSASNSISHPFFNGALPSDRYFNDSKRGWFYYETIQKPLKKEKEAEKSKEKEKKDKETNDETIRHTSKKITEDNETIRQISIANLYPTIDNSPKTRAAILEAEKNFVRSVPFDNLTSLSAEEFRQTYDKIRDIAAMRPDLENSLAYLRLNQFSITQADRFKEIMLIASSDNEFIDPSLASSAYGSKLIREREKERLRSFFNDNRDRLAVAVFYGGLNHPSYTNQRGAVEAFQKDYPNTEILWIDVSSSPETVEKMGLLTIPESWLAWKKEDSSVIWRRITAGVAAYEDYEKKPLFLWEKTIAGDVFANTVNGKGGDGAVNESKG